MLSLSLKHALMGAIVSHMNGWKEILKVHQQLRDVFKFILASSHVTFYISLSEVELMECLYYEHLV